MIKNLVNHSCGIMKSMQHGTIHLIRSLRTLGAHRIALSRKRERGAVAVEFALISPVLFLCIIGIVELSLIMFTKHVIESATFNASRTSKTGYVEVGLTQQQTIKKALEDRLSGLVDVSKVTIASKSYTNFSGVEQPEPFVDANGNGVWNVGENFTDINGNGAFDADRGKTGAGSTTNIVVYTVTYPWKVFTPLMGQFFGDAFGNMLLSARIVVKNEPY
jgi:Flp pilus assembly protein TadG